MIKLDTICQLAKSMNTKAVKGDGGAEVVNCELKFSALPVPRDAVDMLLGMPDGWSQRALFDEQGAPLRILSIASPSRRLRVTGTISGANGTPRLALIGADLSDIESGLVTLGGHISGLLSWATRGDEGEDIAELLGKTCRVEWQVNDGEQDDLFTSHAVAREATKRVMEGLGKAQP